MCRPLRRDSLFGALDEATEGAAAWVGAMAGAGKTTLVATWTEQRGYPAVWMQLDAGDSDPTTFFHYLSLAVASHERKRRLPLAVPEALSDIGSFARRYFRALYQALRAGSVLVFDNFQEARADALIPVLDAAIAERPDTHRVVVISRLSPPPPFAQVIARGLLKCLRPEALAFSRDEVHLLTREREDDDTVADRLHAETEGWAAGIVLILEAARGAGMPSKVGVTRREMIFEYFAEQIFSGLDSRNQDVLLRTALLPSVTPNLAAKLTARCDAGDVLSGLYERKLFTYRSGEGGTYQYHRLFREFLLQRARHVLGRKGFVALATHAAELLDADNSIEAALELALCAEAWDYAATLIVRNAPHIAAQNRWSALLSWIDSLPGSMVDSRAWLVYWRGVALSATRSEAALRVLEQAVEAFADCGDAQGQLLASSEGLHCAFRLWSFTESADRFLTTIQRLLGEEHRFVDAIRIHALAGAVLGLTYRQPTNRLLPLYAEEVLGALPRIDGCEQRVRAALPILEYFNDLGSFARSERVIATVGAIPGECSPALRYQWWDQLTWQYCYMGLRDPAVQAADKAWHCAESEGLNDLLFLGRTMQCTAAIQFGNLVRAEELLAQMRREFAARVLMHSMRLHWLELWLHLARGDADSARAVWSRWSRLPLAGVPIMYPSSHPVVAVLLLLGEHGQALERIRSWRRQLADFNSPFFDFNLSLMEAAALLAAGEEALAYDALRTALAIGRERKFLCTTTWIPSMMSNLCGEALTRGIEIDYVRTLIRHNGLVAGAAGAMLWPRPVKVLTLGQFCVWHDDKPIEVGRKAPKKVLNLLKVIVAHEGRDVPVESISDLLWPDLEGDAQHVAFSIALHRLRKLLRDPASIRLVDNRISLDAGKVWVDAFALDDILKRALQGEDSSVIVGVAEQALAIYRGPFLTHDPAPWAVSIRERLRSRFVRVIEQSCAVLERGQRLDQAVALYRCGIETDCLAEALYQGLMRCYAALGRPAQALATFRQLEHVLQRVLNVGPSASTKALAAQLATD